MASVAAGQWTRGGVAADGVEDEGKDGLGPGHLKNSFGPISGHDGSIGKHGSPRTTTSKLQLIAEKPSFRSVRNRAEWMSHNYGIK